MTKPNEIILALDLGSSSLRCTAYQLLTHIDDDDDDDCSCPVREVEGCAASRQMRSVLPNTGKVNLGVVVSDDKKKGWTCNLLDQVDDCIDETLSALKKKYFSILKSQSYQIVGIGISTFAMNLVGIGTTDDGRTVIMGDDVSMSYACNVTEVAEECRELKRELGEEKVYELYKRTGTPVHSAYALAQLRVFYRNNPEVKVTRWQTVASLCLARWTGMTTKLLPISFAEASWTGLLNFHTCQWDEDLLNMLPRECRDALPGLADSIDVNAVAGGDGIPQFLEEHTPNPYWDRWPELRGKGNDGDSCFTRLFLGMGDGTCANVGSKCSTSSRIAVTIGTSAAARVCIPLSTDSRKSIRSCSSGVVHESIPPEGLFCYRINRQHVLMGGALTDGGSVVEWATNLLNLTDDKAFADCMDNVKRLEIEESTAKSDVSQSSTLEDLSFVPFLSGERSTGFRYGAKGCVIGITRETTSAHFLKACMEGVVLRLNAILSLITETMSVKGEERKEGNVHCKYEKPFIIASGKALEKNDLWRQMLADCSGLEVITDDDTKGGTSRGAAILVGVALATAANPEGDDVSTKDFLREEKLNVTHSQMPRSSKEKNWSKKTREQDQVIESISPLWC